MKVEPDQEIYLIPDTTSPDPINGQIWAWEDVEQDEPDYFLVLDISDFKVPQDSSVLVMLDRIDEYCFRTIYEEVSVYPQANFSDTKWIYLGKAASSWCHNCEERPAFPDDYLCEKCRWGTV